MVSPQQGLKGLAGAIGFFFGALLLNTLIWADPAAAQCGFGGPFSQNTACGRDALAHNTTGTKDSAFGVNALFSNTTGNDNTASGAGALYNNTTGNDNTASGVNALSSNTTGYYNTASGAEALGSNTTGNDNTASGAFALLFNMGPGNTANGAFALALNTTGSENTASGYEALGSNTTGNFNIGLGGTAGDNIVHGSNNIDIGGSGTADESNTIRIGLRGTQKRTFIAGISGTPVLGADVTVNGNGQLGVLPSSARYKRDIRDMGGASAGLMKLRPVSFRYKEDPSDTLQYGLVAEEVERVYPELVIRGTDDKVMSVRYLEFTALLLNELQKQHTELQKQTEKTQKLAQRLETKDQQIAVQQREIDALKQKDASINALSERLAALEQQVHTATPQGRRSLASK
jgi:hypothetical protein